jgi:glutamyl-tRNA synthetase
MPDVSPPVKDRLRGLVEKTEKLDDQILLKSDGFPTYHLANVVDDHLMEITHVIRAEEWISSTPKHIVLYDAFGWTAPEWIHMPLLRNDDKSKISKRKNPVSLDFYRDNGFLPEALLNFLGNMGYSIGGDREKFTLPDMIETFDIDRVKLGGPVFDLKKLAHLNQQYLAAMSDADLARRLRQWRFSDEMLTKIAALLKPRMQTLGEFAPQAAFFLTGDLEYGPSLIPKGKTPAEGAKALAGLAEKLDALRTWTKESLEPVGRAHAEELGWKTGDLFMLIRVAITGSTASPGLFESMELVGKDLSRRRIRQAIEFLQKQK